YAASGTTACGVNSCHLASVRRPGKRGYRLGQQDLPVRAMKMGKRRGRADAAPPGKVKFHLDQRARRKLRLAEMELGPPGTPATTPLLDAAGRAAGASSSTLQRLAAITVGGDELLNILQAVRQHGAALVPLEQVG